MLKDWSPEQVSGHLKREPQTSLSHQRSYQHSYADQAAGGNLHHSLRCQKKRRKRYGAYDRRGHIPQCVSSAERPKVIATRRRIGEWEADTIIGQHHHQAIVSLVERKSRLTLLKKVERHPAAAVEEAISQLLRPVVAQVRTITSDTGREFANHQALARQLQATFYCAHPYASWERGTNENTNGLVRQYFPKKSDFSKIDDAELARVMEGLNTRPRKTLGFRTPQQVFFKHQSVALRC